MRKFTLKMMSALALLMSLSLGAWAEGGPSGLGTVTSFAEGKYFIFYEDASTVRHYLYVNGSNWATTTTQQVIALSKGKSGWEDTGYHLVNNGMQMSNPGADNGAPGTSNSGRTYETQVFYEYNGKYAIRCTNENNERTSQWWENTYVNVNADGTTVSTAAPSLGEALFVWNVEEIPWSKVGADAAIAAAEETYENTIWLPVEQITNTDQFSSNAPCPSEGDMKNLLDNSASSFFHSDWSGTYPKVVGTDVHELYVSGLSESITDYVLRLTDRSGASNDHIQKMEVYGGELTSVSDVSRGKLGVFNVTSGNDPLATIEINANPRGTADVHEVSFSIGQTGYKALCFRVVNTVTNENVDNYRVYFHAGDFHLLTGDEKDYAAPKYEMESGSTYAADLLTAINALKAVKEDFTKTEAELAALVADVTAAEADVKANAKVQYKVVIKGNPSEAKATIGGKELANGESFKSAPINASDVTATNITHYPYTVTVTGDQVTVTYEGFTVTSLADAEQVNNGFAYLISTSRGYLIANDKGVDVTSTSTTTKADSIFALLKSDKGNYYLYNVGRNKFAGLDGDAAPLSDNPTQALTITDKQNADGYRFMFQYDDAHIFNHNGSKLVVNTYSAPDPGNLHKLVFAGEYDFSAALALINAYENKYTVSITGQADAKVTLGGNAYGNGEEFPYVGDIERKDFTVTHYSGYAEEVTISGRSINVAYTKLPIELTTDMANPKYYVIQSGRENNPVYTYTDDNYILLQAFSNLDTQKWFFIESKVGDARFLQLVPATDPTKVMGYENAAAPNSPALIFAVDPADDTKYSNWIFAEDNGKYGLKPATNPNTYFSNNGGVSNKMGFWTGSPSGDTGTEMAFKVVSTAAMTITDALYGTFVAPFAVTLPNDVTAFKVTGVGAGNELTTEAVETTIPAYTPVVVASTAAVNETFNGLIAPDASLAPKEVGLLTGVFEEEAAQVGTYILNKIDDWVGFAKVADTSLKVGANRCYLTAPATAAPFLRLGGATNIANVNADADANVIYDLMGRRVEAPAKGIYIVNGKKVLVK